MRAKKKERSPACVKEVQLRFADDREIECPVEGSFAGLLQIDCTKDSCEGRHAASSAVDLTEPGRARRNQHRTTVDLAGLQLAIDVNGLLQREFGGLRVDPTLAGHRDHFHQFDTRSPVRDAHRRAVRRAAVMEIVMSAAQTDDGPNAVAPEELCAQVKRRLNANAIEHQTGAARPGDLLDSFGGFAGVAIVDDVVGAERLRLLQLLVVDIRRDNVHRRQHAQKLNGHVAESADADDDDGAVGVEMRQRSLDGVIRSQRGVAQRRRFGRTQVAERYQQPRGRNQHVLRHSAVETESAAEAIHLGPVLAIVLHRQLAGVAATAAPRAVDGHRIAFFETRDTFSERGHPAGVFMTESEGRREAQVFFHHVQIRVAHAGTADLDQHLPGTRLRASEHPRSERRDRHQQI